MRASILSPIRDVKVDRMFFKRLLTVLSLTLIKGLSVFGLVLVAQAAGPWYVSPFGDDGDDCLSAGTACQTIMAAIDKATPGDTIVIAAGTYPESLVITKDLTLQGTAADQTIVKALGGSVASITTTARVTIN